MVETYPSPLVIVVVHDLTVIFHKFSHLLQVCLLDLLKSFCCDGHLLFKLVSDDAVFVHQGLVLFLGLSKFGLCLFQVLLGRVISLQPFHIETSLLVNLLTLLEQQSCLLDSLDGFQGRRFILLDFLVLALKIVGVLDDLLDQIGQLEHPLVVDGRQLFGLALEGYQQRRKSPALGARIQLQIERSDFTVISLSSTLRRNNHLFDHFYVGFGGIFLNLGHFPEKIGQVLGRVEAAFHVLVENIEPIVLLPLKKAFSNVNNYLKPQSAGPYPEVLGEVDHRHLVPVNLSTRSRNSDPIRDPPLGAGPRCRPFSHSKSILKLQLMTSLAKKECWTLA